VTGDRRAGERRIAAILAADLEGYSARVAQDEESVVAQVRRLLADLVTPAVEAAGGRMVKTMGDGFLAEFPSPVSAARCASTLQARVAEEGGGLAFRMGLHLGDILCDRGDIFGDAVNLAARLESIAPAGGIVLSRAMRDQIAANFAARLQPVGPRHLKNLPDPVEVWSLVPELSAGRALVRVSDTQPSVVVMPFAELGPASEDFLADGIVEEVTTALSAIRDFTVIARQSAYAQAAKSGDVQSIGQKLGARYVVTGSVRRSGPRVRVAVQMADAQTGAQIIAERYEDRIEDLFDLQDRIAARVAGSLSPAVRASEIATSRSLAPADRGAYALYMSAFPHFWAHRQAENERAIELLTLALDRDPGAARARALRAWAYAQQACYMWSDEPLAARALAVRDAEAASADVGEHANSLVALAAALSMTTTDQDRARRMLDKALALDPNSAWGWMRSGWMQCYRNDPTAALADFDRSYELSPRDPFLFNLEFGRGFALSLMGDYEGAVRQFHIGLEAGPGVVWAYRDLASFYAQGGHAEEADAALAKLVQHHPGITVKRIHESMPPSAMAHHPTFLEGLRRAGLPDE
jgi:adenylate cyclase